MLLLEGRQIFASGSDLPTTVLPFLYEQHQRLSRFDKLFYPRALRIRLEAFHLDPTDENALAAYRAFFASPTWNFSALRDFSKLYSTKACRLLYINGLLNDENNGLANFHLVLKNPHAPERVAEALVELHRSGLLTETNRPVVYNPTRKFIQTLSILRENGILRGALAQANFDALVRYYGPDLRSIGQSWAQEGRLLHDLSCLKKEGLLTQANFSAVIRGKELVCTALLMLHSKGFLTDANREAVAAHLYPSEFAEALIVCHNHGLLAGEFAEANYRALVRRHDVRRLGSILRLLYDRFPHIDSQAYFNKVMQVENLGPLSNALFTLYPPREIDLATTVRTQAHFDRLMTHSSILLIPEVWGTIPSHALTEARFNRIIQIAEAHAADIARGQEAFRTYVIREILGIDLEAGAGAGARAYNGAQSTHAASVHASASDSALRLKSRYSSGINVTTLDSLSVFLESQSHAANSELLAARAQIEAATTSALILAAQSRVEKARVLVAKTEAAKRGFTRITHPEFTYEDPVSRTSIKELLALLWIGTQDAENRIGGLEDAQKQIIEALYESQREYNLSAIGVDTGGSIDAAACAGGTFNKLIERFHGVHKDVILLIITREGASAKLQALVKQEALAYLQRLKDSGNTAELTRLLDAIIAPANANTVEPLWEYIKSSIEETLFDEFKSLYGDNRSHTAFRALIAAGTDVELPLDRLIALRTSAGTTASETGSPLVSGAVLSAAGVGFFPSPLVAEEAEVREAGAIRLERIG
jgi:hypothetical protein